MGQQQAGRRVGLIVRRRNLFPLIEAQQEGMGLPLRDLAQIIPIGDLQAHMVPLRPVGAVEYSLVDFASLGGKELHLRDEGAFS